MNTTTQKTRDEHLKWCKDRAYEYLDRGDATNAWASFASDMGKHHETSNHIALGLGMQMMFAGVGLRSLNEVREFIRGFN